jgi:hypothetical protein
MFVNVTDVGCVEQVNNELSNALDGTESLETVMHLIISTGGCRVGQSEILVSCILNAEPSETVIPSSEFDGDLSKPERVVANLLPEGSNPDRQAAAEVKATVKSTGSLVKERLIQLLDVEVEKAVRAESPLSVFREAWRKGRG